MRSSPSAFPSRWVRLVQWRQGDRRVAIKILTAKKNVPYIVTLAPLRFRIFIPGHAKALGGVAKCGVVRPAGTGWGNQSSSPRRRWEDIYLIPEQVQRLIGPKLKRWIARHHQKSGELRLCCTAFRLVRRYRNSTLLDVLRSLLKFGH